jgi:hypothetical protein
VCVCLCVCVCVDINDMSFELCAVCCVPTLPSSPAPPFSGEVILTSLGTAEVHVNGRLLGPGGGQGGGAQVRLGHQDRLAFGRFHLFRFDAR